MNSDRRSILQVLAAALGAAALPVHWSEVLQAAQAAHGNHTDTSHNAAAPDSAPKITFLSAADAADIEAVAAQIIPTDDTPGAREAGVIYFIDRALATFLAQLASEYHDLLAEFRTAFRAKHPDAASFASLPSEQQIAFLKTVDRTHFFEATRLLTLLGMFTNPTYGGNRDFVGWQLLGFEDKHVFQPPFGYYDRDYAGFGETK
jgi:gluconate 2-dehydrogenase gamma chain